ncbi:MAG: hypothetical protein ACP5GJ_04390 [Nanopusillaceae archaeon]
MEEEEKILKEIKEIVERFRDRGLKIEMEEKDNMISILMTYENFEKQREIIGSISKKYKIRLNRVRKEYLKYVKKLLEEPKTIIVYYVLAYKNKDNLLEVKEFLEESYNKDDENYYLQLLKEKLENEFNNFVKENIKPYLEREEKQYALLKKYLKYLNKEVDYNEEIENIESLLNRVYYKGDYHLSDDIYKLYALIRKKVRMVINQKNIKYIKIDHGILLIMTYKYNFSDESDIIYEKNKFYLIDFRNNKVMDISNTIEKEYTGGVLEVIDENNLYILDDLRKRNIYELLI